MSEEMMRDAEVIRSVLDLNVKDFVMEDKEHRAAVYGIMDEQQIAWTAIGQTGHVLRTLIKGISRMLVEHGGPAGNPVKAAMLMAKEIVKETRKVMKEAGNRD